MAEPAEKKSGKLRLILIGVPVLLLLIGGGLWFTGVLPHLLGMNHGEKQAAVAAPPVPPSYVEIPEMVDNLDNPGGSHYVKLSARVEVPKPEDVQRVKANIPELQNLLVVYMRDLDTAELRDPTDTDRLRNELLSRANAAVAPARNQRLSVHPDIGTMNDRTPAAFLSPTDGASSVTEQGDARDRMPRTNGYATNRNGHADGLQLRPPASWMLAVLIVVFPVLPATSANALPRTTATDERPLDSVTITVASGADERAGRVPSALAGAASPDPALARMRPGNTTYAAATSGGRTPAACAQPPSFSRSEIALLQQLRHRRKQLDARAAAVSVREAAMAAAELKITARLAELKSLQQQMADASSAVKQKESAGWQSMAKLYEAMRPRDAAVLCNKLAMPILVQMMDHMKSAKAAAVLQAMDPDKAVDATSALAELRSAPSYAGPDGRPDQGTAGSDEISSDAQ